MLTKMLARVLPTLRGALRDAKSPHRAFAGDRGSVSSGSPRHCTCCLEQSRDGCGRPQFTFPFTGCMRNFTVAHLWAKRFLCKRDGSQTETSVTVSSRRQDCSANMILKILSRKSATHQANHHFWRNRPLGSMPTEEHHI